MNKEEFVKSFNILNISTKELVSLGRDTGFIQRLRKIDSLDFMYSLSKESMQGIASYNDISAAFENINGTTISRQAICRKVTETCVLYFQRVLELVILSKSNDHLLRKDIICKFNRVLIQDSTIIQIPKRLFEFFSGVSNKTTTVCNARIQGVYDLLSGKFISFSINPYTKNDHVSASEIEITKDDLTLRDRGYLNADEIRRHIKSGAHCIYRYKMKMKFLDYESFESIDILDLLKKNGSIDRIVRLNDEEKTVVRMVARPVDQATADRRRMKAKREMKGHNPCKIVLELQSWTIFITTMPSVQADFNTLLKIYGLRWRIETIFKTWKSNMYFAHLQNVSRCQFIVTVIMRMIMFLIINQQIYAPCKRLIHKQYGRTLSLMKLIKYLVRNTSEIALLLTYLESDSPYIISHSMSRLARHCVYDKRKRQNFEQQTGIIYCLS